jgi:hypothetical protein
MRQAMGIVSRTLCIRAMLATVTGVERERLYVALLPCKPPKRRETLSRTALCRGALQGEKSNTRREQLYAVIHADKERVLTHHAAFGAVLPYVRGLVYRYLLRYGLGMSRADIAKRIGHTVYRSDSRGNLVAHASTQGGGLLDDIINDAYVLHRERKLSPRAAIWCATSRMVRRDGRTKQESRILSACEALATRRNGVKQTRASIMEDCLADARMDFPELFASLTLEKELRQGFQEVVKELKGSSLRSRKCRERQRRNASKGSQLAASIWGDDVINHFGSPAQAPRHYASKNRATVGVQKTIQETTVNPFCLWNNKYGETMAIPVSQLETLHQRVTVGKASKGEKQTPYTMMHTFRTLTPVNEKLIGHGPIGMALVCKQNGDYPNVALNGNGNTYANREYQIAERPGYTYGDFR